MLDFVKESRSRTTTLENSVKAIASTVQSQGKTIQNLEVQLSQMATSLQTMQKGKFPSCPETLRSGKKLSTPLINDEDDEAIMEYVQQKESASKEKEKSKSNIGSTSNSTSFIPNTLPFPQRFQKKKIDAQFSKFLDIFKKLEINLPFAEALEQMPKYAKFMKDVLSKKKRYGDYEVVALTEECSTALQRKLPQKLKDPGSFSIPCHLGNNKVTKHFVILELLLT